MTCDRCDEPTEEQHDCEECSESNHTENYRRLPECIAAEEAGK